MAAVSAAFAGSALAVSADEAKQLCGPVLTCIGAEKAGNKEGTIPAYTGEVVKRQSLRGQTRIMIWCLLTNPIGMFGAWYFLDPYFRSPLWLTFGTVTISWAAFNVWLMYKYPDYVPDAGKLQTT